MSDQQHIIGVVFEGVGPAPDDSVPANGVVWYFGPSRSTSGGGYYWYGGRGSGNGLVDFPKTVAANVDPFTADLDLSAMQFELHLDDYTAEKWLGRARNPTNYVNESTAGLEHDETTLTVSSDFDNVGANGDVVWIGDEAIELGGSVGSFSYTSITRGVLGTLAQAVPSWTAVYTKNPYQRHRICRVLRYDVEADTTTTVWRGVVQSVRTDRHGTKLIIAAREILSGLANAETNMGAPDLMKEIDLRFLDDEIRTGVKLSPPRVRYKAAKQSPVTGHMQAFQIGEGMFYGAYIASSEWKYELGTFVTNSPGSGVPQLGSPLPDREDAEEGELEAYELFVVDREHDHADGTQNANDECITSTIDLDHPWHPVAISMALLVSDWRQDASGYNVLGPEIGVGAPVEFFDITDIDATISRTARVQVERLILGWDGEPIEVWPTIKMLCRTYGFFPALTSEGKITFREYRRAGVEQLATGTQVTAIPYELQETDSTSDGFDVLRGKYNILPWNEGTPYRAQVVDRQGEDQVVPTRSRRAGYLSEIREREFDMPTRARLNATADQILMMIAARAVAPKRVSIRVHDPDLTVGDHVLLAELEVENEWLVDEDSNRVHLSAFENYETAGMVVGYGRQFEDGSANLELLLTNLGVGGFVRLRAPSAMIDGADDGDATYSVVQDEFSADDNDDAGQFTVGDKIELWSPSGFRRSSESTEIDSISGQNITVDTAFATAPEDGDIIRLAHLDDADGQPEAGNPNKFDGYQAYTYLGDDSDEVTPSDTAGHQYGVG